LGPGAIALITLGGVFYTVGVVFFVTERPQLFPRAFSYHELFHVFVVLASVSHFLAIVTYAVPASV
jgi:hemolysin III